MRRPANRCAMAAPIPRLAPVTRATFAITLVLPDPFSLTIRSSGSLWELGLRTSQAVRFASVSQFVDGALHPPAGSVGRQTVDLFVRSYQTLLRSTGEVRVAGLLEPYLAMAPSLHVASGATRYPMPPRSPTSGCACRRACPSVRLVLLSASVETHGRARLRRRRELDAPDRARAPSSTLLRRPRSARRPGQQPERPRRHHPGARRLRDRVEQAPRAARVATTPCGAWSSAPRENGPATRRPGSRLAEALVAVRRPSSSVCRSSGRAARGSSWLSVAERRKRLAVRMLGGTWNDYERAVERWFEYVADHSPPDLSTRPIYFVSSNMHSLVNLLSGSAMARQARHHRLHPGLRQRAAARRVRSASRPIACRAASRTSCSTRPRSTCPIRATPRPPPPFAAEEHAAGMTTIRTCRSARTSTPRSSS